MRSLPLLVVIAGPTAAGKTAAAVELCGRMNAEIVSCDSMQVYRGMDIGTSKPSLEVRAACRHHMIDVAEPAQAYNAHLYRKGAVEAIDDIVSRGKTPLAAGGTGLYLRALLEGFSNTIPEGSTEIRAALEQEACLKGSSHLHERLKALDPASAGEIHPNNTKRVIRALEICLMTGSAMSKLKTQNKNTKLNGFKIMKFGLLLSKEELWRRINARVDEMILKGLVEEVRSLARAGLRGTPTARYGIGYKEILDYIDQRCGLDESVSLIKKRTRQYAKRQMTWFNADKEITWLDGSDFKNAIERIHKTVLSTQISH